MRSPRWYSYLVASPFLNPTNAPRTILFGLVLMAAGSLAYLFVRSFWGVVILRMLNGAGLFCTSAGAMALLVSIIPPEKSGQAFGLYSVAMLLAYATVPALTDSLAPFIPTPPHAYAVASVSLLPAAWIVWRIRGRQRQRAGAAVSKEPLPTWADIRTNVTRLPVALLLVLNLSYFISYGSLFFLFKGFALQQGLSNVGAFFTVQIASMILIRLFAGRLFDLFSKAKLVGICFIIVALGYLALDNLPGTWAVPFVGILVGTGLGLGTPAINGLMYQVSPPRFRSLNANLLLFTVQAGFFFGPVMGGALVARWDYHGYFLAGSGLAFVATTLSLVLTFL